MPTSMEASSGRTPQSQGLFTRIYPRKQKISPQGRDEITLPYSYHFSCRPAWRYLQVGHPNHKDSSQGYIHASRRSLHKMRLKRKDYSVLKLRFKEVQLGLVLLINHSFFLRPHFFSCFSRAIASLKY